MNTFSLDDKVYIERDIQKDFAHALIGVKTSKIISGRCLFNLCILLQVISKIQSISYSKILSQRIRINNFRKCIWYLVPY